MICKNCGKELAENEKFCSACGSKAEIPVRQNSDDDIILRRFDCAKSGTVKAVFMVIFGLSFVVDGIIYMDLGGSQMEAMGKVFIILGIVVAALAVYIYKLYQKRFCLIKANSVCGVTCGNIDLINENFEFNYADVISIQKKKITQTISVQTKYKKINIFLPSKEMNSAYELLQQKIKM